MEEAPRRESTSRRLRSASASAAGAPPIVFELPMTRDEAVQGAVEGIRRAWAAGQTPPEQGSHDTSQKGEPRLWYVLTMTMHHSKHALINGVQSSW